MNRRRIAMMPVAASLCATCIITAVPAAKATPAPAPGPLPVGPGAFTLDPFTGDPSPALRNRAIANALLAISQHPQQAHLPRVTRSPPGP